MVLIWGRWNTIFECVINIRIRSVVCLKIICIGSIQICRNRLKKKEPNDNNDPIIQKEKTIFPKMFPKNYIYDVPKKKTPCELQLKRAYPKLSLHLLSSTIQQALRDKFNQIIPFSKIGDKTGKEGITYFELFQALSGFDYVKQQPYIVMIKGGFVRDLVQGKSLDDIHDIDVVYTKPYEKVLYGKQGLLALNVKHNRYKDKDSDYYFLKIGQETTVGTEQSVDCTHLDLTTSDYSHYEAPVNTLMINVSQSIHNTKNTLQYIYDITGQGYEHAKRRVWDVPSEDLLDNKSSPGKFWLSHAKLWRMLKFQLRGYTVSATCKRHIYDYWLHHYLELPLYNWKQSVEEAFLERMVHRSIKL